MTKDEIKKELERSARLTGKDVFVDAYKIITEQENEIERLRTTLGQCNTELNSALESLKSQCREIGALRAKVKQAQIDVLNTAKERLYSAPNGWAYTTYIDELIEEVENENNSKTNIPRFS